MAGFILYWVQLIAFVSLFLMWINVNGVGKQLVISAGTFLGFVGFSCALAVGLISQVSQSSSLLQAQNKTWFNI